MPTASIRTVLPLAAVTGTSMLAMDLFLPAVPALQRGLDASVPQGQATVALFLAGLAASQLVWGELLHRVGPRRCVRIGLGLLIVTTFGCAAAPDIGWLLALRLLQGIAAGAATVVAPTVIRATLPDRDGVRGIAAVSMIEAIVPAAGPVLGSALLLVADWRWSFVAVGVLALASMPFALAATPPVLPERRAAAADAGRTERTGYAALLGCARYVRLALSHAFSLGALFAFVASAPQVLDGLRLGAGSFALLQVCGVAAFIAMASQSGRISARLGPGGAVQLGAWGHALLCAALLLATLAGAPPLPWLIAFWMAFCGLLGVRGPSCFSDALAVPTAQMGRASALMVLALLVAGSLATQATAPFLAGHGLRAVAATMTLLTLASLALVVRYPPPVATAS